MTEPRERRGLVPVEILGVIALALVPWPETLPVALPLVVAASLSRWLRGRSWAELITGGAEHVALGTLVGVAALATALVAGAPLVEAVSQRAVEWSVFPIVRGQAAQLAVVIVMVAITAIAAEMALRGWLVERVLELSPGSPVLPVMCGALAEALITPGDAAIRLGAGLFGAGLGALYVAGSRSLVAPVLARLTFAATAVVLESLRLIG